MFLSAEEIEELTGKKQAPAQARQLAQMGFNFRIRADGFPVVLRAHVEKVLDGLAVGSGKTRSRPNFDHI